MSKRIRLKTGHMAGTRADFFVGGKAPKRRPRPGARTFVYRLSEEPPESGRSKS